MKKKIFQLFSVLVFAAAAWILHHELRTYHYHDIVRQLREIPLSQVLAALLATALGYLALTGYDTLGVRYAGQKLRYPQIAFISFISYAFSHNTGNPLISGAIRYRLYSALGLSAIEIAQVIAFCVLTFWVGFLTLSGVIFLTQPLVIPDALRVPFISIRSFGVIFLIVLSIYLAGTLLHKQRLKIGKWELALPSWQFVTWQLVVSCLDWMLVSSVIYLLLPKTAHIAYPKFLGIFLLCQILGLISQVPGGLGVFEALMIEFFKPLLPADVVLGALLVYRVMYYALPLVLAIIFLALEELKQRQEVLKQAVNTLGQWFSPVIPSMFALTTFLGGIILVFSGATPSERSRLAWLKDFLPLPVLELSHFLGSIAGVGLILLARGLQRRLDGAYFLTVLLLGAGIIGSLLKGFDYEEALILTAMLIALLPCHDQFYRKASLIEQRFTPGWLVALFVVIASSIWLGFFAYQHVEYSHDLWWHFSFFHGDASRFLRATVGVIIFATFFALANLMRAAKPQSIPPTPADLTNVRTIVTAAPETRAYLALLGDKRFLFSPSAKAFLMYGLEGKSWVAMGDPVGPQAEYSELIWRFRELCDQHGGWPVFYEVGREHLPIYIDQGLTLLKLGEEARVPLAAFALEGKHRKHQRNLVNKLEKEGGSFEILRPETIAPFFPELQAISDDWLAQKNTGEKRFSLGSFNPAYLSQMPLGAVRQNGKLVAFGNLWLGGQKAELSLDLMRYSADAPANVMEYLFLKLILWGKQEGYTWFNLGMAPLAGIENRPVAPLWNRLTALVYHQGEHFYNFQGLRQYKEKFDPVWEPRYLASPGGIALPLLLTNLIALISGGLKGAISR